MSFPLDTEATVNGSRKLASLALSVPDKMRFRWKNIGHIMARTKKSCLILTWFWTYCPMIIGHNVQRLLDILSNDYLTHFPMIIGYIVQWLCDKLLNIYLTESKVSMEYSTHGPSNIGKWTICPRYINNKDCPVIIDYWIIFITRNQNPIYKSIDNLFKELKIGPKKCPKI
jgi:hypothetical protein